MIKKGFHQSYIGACESDGTYLYPVLYDLYWRMRGRKNMSCSRLTKPLYGYNHFVIRF